MNIERIFFAESSYADLIAHARASLDAEVCGVLVGQIRWDREVAILQITATIRGDKAREGSTHVTFTQETWVHIHETLERDHPDMKIIGWYHTHPGFGVEFSEMDLFVHRNFFSGGAQIALVTDPLSGEVAVLLNRPNGSVRLDRIWVGHREIRCQMPPSDPPSPPSVGGSSMQHQTLEQKFEHFLQTAEAQREELLSWLMAAGALIAIAILLWVGVSIFAVYTANRGVPDLIQHGSLPVLVELEGKTVFLDAQIVGVEIPNDKSREAPGLSSAFEKKDMASPNSTFPWYPVLLSFSLVFTAVLAILVLRHRR